MSGLSKYWLAASICLLTCLPAVADQEPWTEIRSPHFRVLTNGSKNDARHVARQLEEIRSVFTGQFRDLRLESNTPLLVLVPRDLGTWETLEPRLRKHMSHPMALFRMHGEVSYAVITVQHEMVRLVPYPTFGYVQLLNHDYVHGVLSANLRWLPLWLKEGLASFYGYTRFDRNEINIGAPPPDLRDIENRVPLPIESLIDVDYNSPFSKYSGGKLREIDTEFWALVHFLIFGPDMGGGKRLDEYCRALQQGADPTKSFQQVFGDFAPLNKQLRENLGRISLDSILVKSTERINEDSFTVRNLSVAETEVELGTYHLRNRDFAEAKASIEQAVQDAPTLPLAHEAMGFLKFHEGKDKDAAAQFAQAYENNSKLYLSLFFKTMLADYPDTLEGQSALNLALLQNIQTNPLFATPYAELAKLDLRTNKLTNALTVIRKAEQLEPSRIGYYLLEAQLLLHMGRGAEAVPLIKFVAMRGAHDEALQLWNSLPSDQKPAEELPPEKNADGIQTASGSIRSVNCNDKNQLQQIVLDPGGQTATFHVPEKDFFAGLADSVWYGGDHFDTCQHMQGMRAFVRYKAAPDGSYAGNLTQLQVREPFVSAPSVEKSVSTAAAHKE